MSRNIGQTVCYHCQQPVKLVEVSRPITKTEANGYFDEYRGMLVANAVCTVCEAKYLAWVDCSAITTIGHLSREPNDRRLFVDLSFRSAFNDEPGVADAPRWCVDKATLSKTPWPCCSWCKAPFSFETSTRCFECDTDRSVHRSRLARNRYAKVGSLRLVQGTINVRAKNGGSVFWGDMRMVALRYWEPDQASSAYDTGTGGRWRTLATVADKRADDTKRCAPFVRYHAMRSGFPIGDFVTALIVACSMLAGEEWRKRAPKGDYNVSADKLEESDLAGVELLRLLGKEF